MKTILCEDSLPWMAANPNYGGVVTSLPDAEETGMEIPAWQAWFTEAARLACLCAKPEAAAIFYQTDRKSNGETISKAELLFRAARFAGSKIMWHKIVLRRGVGKTDIHRPGFTHLICFSRKGKPGTATPDVIERGEMIYPNAMGINAARVAIGFCGHNSTIILDPFCGRGTVPAIAESMGLDSLGIDIDIRQCKAARLLGLNYDLLEQ